MEKPPEKRWFLVFPARPFKVPGAGFEPASLKKTIGPKPIAVTNFATPAN